MGELIKVLIVDDHASLRNSFEKEFIPEHGFTVVASIPAAALAAERCQTEKPDIVIMDVCTVGDISGLQAAEIILVKYPHIKIIITSGYDEITYCPRAKQIGAHAFVEKGSSLTYFREVARRVLDGEYVFPEPRSIPLPIGEPSFSEREMEVLKLFCKGMKPPEIADKLGMTESTARKHIDNMRLRAGFDSSVALAIHVVSNGWINPNI